MSNETSIKKVRVIPEPIELKLEGNERADEILKRLKNFSLDLQQVVSEESSNKRVYRKK